LAERHRGAVIVADVLDRLKAGLSDRYECRALSRKKADERQA